MRAALDQGWALGGGIWNVDWDDARSGASENLTALVANVGYGVGLGTRCDLEAGIRGEQAFVSFRWQPVGRSDDPFRSRRSPLDVSLEAGCGASALALVFPLVSYVPYAETYLGTNLSFPVGRTTPYLSYRCCWGTFRYRWPEGDPSGEVRSEWLQREAFFMGLDVPLSRDSNSRLDVEVYYGRSPRDVPVGTEITHEMWGLNVMYRIGAFD